MSKPDAMRELTVDVVVLGHHPSSYFAAVLLRHKTKLRVLHATIPGSEPADRLVLVSPKLFDLHPLLTPLRKSLNLTDLFGIRFLADDPAVHSEHRSKSTVT